MDEFNEIIKKISEEEGIKVTLLSDNWLTILEKDNQIHYIQGYKFGLNDHGIGNIMDDKGLFNDLLTYKGIPTVYQKVIFHDYNAKDVLSFFHDYHDEIIVKGNIGTCGKEVYKIDNDKALFPIIDKLLLSQFSISLSPYYHIQNEYRVILLNGNPRVIYGKIRPEVVGDGKSTLRELAINFNDFYRDYPFDNALYVPKTNEKIVLNYQFNLSNGAKMFQDINDDLKNRLIILAQNVVRSLNISFASVDIIVTDDNRLLVLEANSGVMMNHFIHQAENGYEIAYNLYRDAICEMFKK